MAKKQQGGRRKFLARGAALVSGAAVLNGTRADNLAGEAWERVYGAGFTRYGQPSRFEQAVGRHIAQPYGEMAPGSGASARAMTSPTTMEPSSIFQVGPA